MRVNVRLTQGPQNMAPTMMTMANSGKNDLPKTRPVPDKNARLRCSMLHSFPLRPGLRGAYVAASTHQCPVGICTDAPKVLRRRGAWRIAPKSSNHLRSSYLFPEIKQRPTSHLDFTRRCYCESCASLDAEEPWRETSENGRCPPVNYWAKSW